VRVPAPSLIINIAQIRSSYKIVEGRGGGLLPASIWEHLGSSIRRRAMLQPMPSLDVVLGPHDPATEMLP
jgi:hypothetical protein